MEKIKFLIICTGYNCENYAKRCLESIKSQTYTNYVVSIVDDGSTDKTFSEINNNTSPEWVVDQFENNKGTIFARNQAIDNFKDQQYDAIVLLDMDDYIVPDALKIVEEKYNDPNCLMTYGNYKSKGGKIFDGLYYSAKTNSERSFRTAEKFRCTHLRTFKRSLYEAVTAWSPTKSEIESYPDVHYLFSMMEMAGADRIAIVDEPIYVYNDDNPMQTLRRFGKDNLGYDEIIKRPKFDLI